MQRPGTVLAIAADWACLQRLSWQPPSPCCACAAASTAYDPCAGKSPCYKSLAGQISVLGGTYAAWIVQVDPITSFNAYYGPSTPAPPLSVNTDADALAVIDAIKALKQADPGLNIAPAPGANYYMGFRVAYAADATAYTFR